MRLEKSMGPSWQGWRQRLGQQGRGQVAEASWAGFLPERGRSGCCWRAGCRTGVEMAEEAVV